MWVLRGGRDHALLLRRVLRRVCVDARAREFGSSSNWGDVFDRSSIYYGDVFGKGSKNYGDVFGASSIHRGEFCSLCCENKPRFRDLHRRVCAARSFLAALTDQTPSFIEVYGRGKLLDAAHGCRRNLGLRGFAALDLRTCKPDATAWNVITQETANMLAVLLGP